MVMVVMTMVVAPMMTVMFFMMRGRRILSAHRSLRRIGRELIFRQERRKIQGHYKQD
jgi:hypothetical protein